MWSTLFLPCIKEGRGKTPYGCFFAVYVRGRYVFLFCSRGLQSRIGLPINGALLGRNAVRSNGCVCPQPSHNIEARRITTMRNVKPLLFVCFLIIIGIAGSTGFAQKLTVTMVADTRQANLEWQQAMVEEFNATHPAIQIELVGGALRGNILTKMQTMMAAGMTPDIGYMDPWLIIEWGKQGIIEDLSPYLAADEETFVDWNPVVFEFFKVRGGTYAVPLDLQIGAVFYNVDHYDTAGLHRPTSDWTYDDLRENARKLTVWNADGAVIRSGFRTPGSRNWVPVVWSFGGDLLDDWADPTHYTGNSPATAAALHYLRDMMAGGIMQTTTDFAAGTASMQLTNTIAMTALHQIDAFEWDVIGMPHGPANKTGFINAIGWFIFSESPHKDAAWEVLRYFASPEAQLSRVAATGNTPASTFAMVEAWLPGLERPANRHVLLDEIPYTRSPWPLHGDVWRPIDEHVVAAINDRMPIESALTTLESRVMAVLQEVNR